MAGGTILSEKISGLARNPVPRFQRCGRRVAKPTQLLIFGNPKLGTPLMLAKRTIGVDLPLKALAWQDDSGKVWLGYTTPAALKARHGVSGRDEIFKKMTGALDKLTNVAIKAE